MMKTLLVGTDFSTRSARALDRATDLAREGDFEIIIAAITETPGDRSDLAFRLKEMAREIANTGIACRGEIRSGQAPEELARLARETDASLMIIGAHRRSFLRDLAGPVTAEQIINLSPVPLLAISDTQDHSYRRVLLPVALDDQSRHAAKVVRELGFTAGVEIVLLHVYDAPAREMHGRAFMRGDEKEAYVAECAAEAREELRDFAKIACLADARQVVSEATAPTGRLINQIASKERAGLVVLSRSRKGTLARGIVGSVTRDLLRAANCDVLMVPEP